jgi:hypothetical protein
MSKYMSDIEYNKVAGNYRPKKIKILLIGEAPPPSGKTYFYVPKVPVRKGSLPATIFQHYFGRNPETEKEYVDMLKILMDEGIFLIDIYDEPIKILDKTKPRWRDMENLDKVINEIPNLRGKIKKRQINIKDENITFLLARNDYKKVIKQIFPDSKLVSWKKFRETKPST